MRKKISGIFIAITALITGGFFGYFVLNTAELVYENIKGIDTEIVAIPKITASEKKEETLAQTSKEEEEEIKVVEEKKGYVLENKKAIFPDVTAEAFLVADLETGQIIASNNSDVKYPIASITKLMTALVARDILDDKEVAVASEGALLTFSESGQLVEGGQYSIGTLTYPLLLESSNDASEVIAEYWNRSIFISLMNKRAEAINLFNTHFSDPSGISPLNTSTAEELLQLTQHILKTDPEIFKITRLKQYSLADQTWYNISKFRNEENYLGGKNGETTQAGKTIISIFDLPLEANGESRKIIIVALKSEKLEADVRRIVSFLNKNVYYYQ